MADTASENSGRGLYERLGEFHDLFMVEPWERLRPAIAQAFGQYGADRRIVDVGAGTGLGVRVLAAETEARITALEPSLVMRAALTARVADSADLSARVTVLAGSVPDDLNSLPQQVDGFVCANMIGHLRSDERRALFSWLDGNLTDDGAGLITVQPRSSQAGATAEASDAESFEERRTLGDCEYRVVYEQATASDQYSTLYEVRQAGELIRSERYTGPWTAVSAEDLEGELQGTSLIVQRVGSTAVLLRRP